MAYDRQEMINAIYMSAGNISEAADRIGCTPLTIYRNAKKYATVQAAIDEARSLFGSELLDLAESALKQALTERKAWAVRYVLEAKGKQRGYDPRATPTMEQNTVINVTFGGEDLNVGDD